MKTEGKNWGKLLENLHHLHKFTHLGHDEKDKLRTHYNSLKDKKSSVWKPYVTPKFVRPKGATREEVIKAEQRHGQLHETAAQERETMRGWLKLIEERERLHTSNQVMTEAEITKAMKEKGEERR
jgi:hypothetical protein